MNEVLLSHEVIVYLVAETILFLLLFIAALSLPSLITQWNYHSFESRQLELEKRSYLVMSIISLVLILKVFLILYFVYTLDTLSGIISGAMCAAGVIKVNEYGNLLLGIKIILIFLGLTWISINSLDLKAKEYPYHGAKTALFGVMFALFVGEYLLDLLYFTHIQTTQPVTCCSVIFGQLGSANPLPFGLDTTTLMALFYLLYLLIVVMVWGENDWGQLGATLAFFFVAYFGVVYFFGTYIYELPTHKCPFCMLQKEYYGIGYLLWGLLFLGVWSGVNGVLMKRFFGHTSSKRLPLILLTLFVAINSLYVIVYYFKTGTIL